MNARKHLFLLTTILACGITAPAAAERKVGDFVMVGKTKFMIWGGAATGIMPKGASTSPDNKYLLVSNFGRKGRQNISVFLANPMTFHKYIDYPGNSIESVVSPDSSTLYSTNMYGHWLDIIDLKTMTWKSKVKVTGFPKVIILNKTGSLAYLSLWEQLGFARFNTKTLAVDYFRTGQVNPRGMALSLDEGTLYLVNNGNKNYTIVDAKNLTPGVKITARHLPLGSGPRHAVMSRDGKRLYVSMMGPSAVFVIDPVTEKVIKTVNVGNKPKSIIESTDGKFIYTANYTGHSMNIIDTATWESKELPLDIVRASGITALPNDKFIYVTGWCTDDIWAVQRIDPGQSAQTPMGTGFKRRVCRDCKRDWMGCELVK
ncbi:MAG: hypothetical protein CVU65_04570 [Deltaproteobacteria bacterium HGW-Deltaproteobacteria-22]|nr:MAG: hypothetical protein CVU65_04570 [Deltaproteobacteria bacterium HGW-Deltaproteobacteria-22]